MSPLALEWIVKAEADLATASREMRVRKNPNHDAVCFHAQQCVEKLLKAALIDKCRNISKTHDLNHLLDRILSDYPLWESHRSGFQELVAYAVEFRYPGEEATREMAQSALKSARAFHRDFLEDFPESNTSD